MSDDREEAITTAMYMHDDYVLQMEYEDAEGTVTNRLVSPIRWDGNKFLALCLGRCEPRTFYADQCSNTKLIPAHDVEIPEKIKVLREATKRDSE